MRTSDQFTAIEGQPRDYVEEQGAEDAKSIWLDVWATVVNFLIILFH